ncbi:hypothetical protein [Novosphingobium colocasiae]|uniref:hypothetical protein n=1 Tax=Novosphingobium colocasiae TaxID=1256513 RepID=UPI001675FE85|nr:hypothetical protein [Novosphingobium colocasiae]
MRAQFTKSGQSLALLTALAASAAWPTAGSAQDAGGWSLPPAPATQAPTQQGPVDTDHPVVSSPKASPTPTPRPTASVPTPRPTVPSDAAPARTAPSPAANAPTAAATPAAPATPVDRAVRDSRPARPAPAAAPTVQEEWYPAPDPTVTAPPRPASQGPGWLAWWWIVPAGLLALVAVLLVAAGVFSARRRSAVADADPDTALQPEPDDTPDIATAGDPTPPQPAPAPPSPAFAPPPTPQRPAAGMASLDILPGKLRLSLVYATLPLRIAAVSDEPDPRAPFTVHGDLGYARSGQSAEEQLAPPLAQLAPLGRIGPELGGFAAEVRLPLATVEPLRQAGTSAFVPLLRLAFVGADGTLVARRAFVLGLPGETGGLQPIRLDLGPRDIADIAMRSIPMPETASSAAKFALDPAHAAG